MDLIYSMGHWHGLAKLRMHHDLTLNLLDSLTETLGEQLRNFSQKICPEFDTVELQREQQVRLRREAKRASARYQMPSSQANAASPINEPGHSQPTNLPAETPNSPIPPTQSASVKARRRRKTLNINTYKFHSYGDYVRTIRRYGTTDSYSTEPVCGSPPRFYGQPLNFSKSELEHRTSKSRYLRTCRKRFVKQLTQIERRQARIRRICERLRSASNPPSSRDKDVPVLPEFHHDIGRTQNLPVDLGVFVQDHMDDPAVKVSRCFMASILIRD